VPVSPDLVVIYQGVKETERDHKHERRQRRPKKGIPWSLQKGRDDEGRSKEGEKIIAASHRRGKDVLDHLQDD